MATSSVSLDKAQNSSIRQHIHLLFCGGESRSNLKTTCKCDAVGTAAIDTINSGIDMTQPTTLTNVAQLREKQKIERSIGQGTPVRGCSASCNHGCQQKHKFKQAMQPSEDLLVGFVTNIAENGDKTGQLYFKDNTGTIRCQVLNFNMNWLRQLLVFYCWNYLPDSRPTDDDHYIEPCLQCEPLRVTMSDHLADVTGWPLFVSRVITDHRKVLDLQDVVQLLKDRSKEGASKSLSAHITLHGIVTAKSPTYRVRGTPFFFVELSADNSCNPAKVNILAKGVETAYLHYLLPIGHQAVITKLLPTTINKGTRTPYPVLLCTSQTQIKLEGHSMKSLTPTVSGRIVNCVNKETGIYDLDGEIRLYLCYQYDGSKQHQQYRVGTKIAVYNAHDYMIGGGGGKTPIRCIICCMKSTVVIMEQFHVTDGHHEAASASCYGNNLLRLITKLNPCPSALSFLCHVWPELQNKDLHIDNVINPVQSPVWKLVTHPSSNNSISWIKPRKRNVYEEFLGHHTHPCVAAASGVHSIDSNAYVQFPSIFDVCNFFSSASEHADSIDTISDSKNWRCKTMASTKCQPPMVLVGQLKSSSHTGHLQIVDKTGQIQCIITNTQTLPYTTNITNLCDLHKRCGPHNAATSTSGDYSTSSQHVLLPSGLDHIIRVDRFSVVVEEFVHDEDGTDNAKQFDDTDCKTKSCGRDWRCVYVVFSMEDAVILCRSREVEPVKMAVKRTASLAGLKRQDSNIATKASECLKSGLNIARTASVSLKSDSNIKATSSDSLKSDSNIATTSSVSLKSDSSIATTSSDSLKSDSNIATTSSDNLTSDSNIKATSDALNKQLDSAKSTFIPYVKQSAKTNHNQKSNLPTSVQFVTKHISWLQQESADSKHLSLFVDVELLEGFELITKAYKDFSKQATGASAIVDKSKRHVALWFRQEAIRWFPVLHPGCVYSLSLAAEIGPVLQTNFKFTKPAYIYKKEMARFGCHQILGVSSKAILRALQEKELSSDILTDYRRIKANLDVLRDAAHRVREQLISTVDDEPGGSIVTFWGQIVSCHYESSYFRYGSQPAWQMRIQVKDLERDDNTPIDDLSNQIRVYINILPLTYKAGLIPGSVAIFRRVIKHISARGNVSYKFGLLSDVTVEHFPLHRQQPDIIPAASESSSSIPHYYLSELSTKQLSPMTHFNVNCQVLAINLMILSWSCDKCGRQKCICLGPSSSSDTHLKGKVNIQAKFAVEDGSGEATVWCHEEGAIPVLLGLTSAMWHQLKETLVHCGSKVVYKYSREENSQFQDMPELPQIGDDLESVLGALCRHRSIQQPISMKCRLLHSNQQTKRSTYQETGASGRWNDDSEKRFAPWLHLKCTEVTVM